MGHRYRSFHNVITLQKRDDAGCPESAGPRLVARPVACKILDSYREVGLLAVHLIASNTVNFFMLEFERTRARA